MSKRVMLLAALILSVSISAQCGGVKEDQVTIDDRGQKQGEATVEVLRADNCTGTSDMIQDIQAMKEFIHDVDIRPMAGVTMNRQAVENEIRTYYKIPEGSGKAVCIVSVRIPPNTFYAYDLEWREVWREGVFELGEPDGKQEGVYEFKQSLVCSVVGQKAQPCP